MSAELLVSTKFAGRIAIYAVVIGICFGLWKRDVFAGIVASLIAMPILFFMTDISQALLTLAGLKP